MCLSTGLLQLIFLPFRYFFFLLILSQFWRAWCYIGKILLVLDYGYGLVSGAEQGN